MCMMSLQPPLQVGGGGGGLVGGGGADTVLRIYFTPIVRPLPCQCATPDDLAYEDVKNRPRVAPTTVTFRDEPKLSN